MVELLQSEPRKVLKSVTRVYNVGNLNFSGERLSGKLLPRMHSSRTLPDLLLVAVGNINPD